MRTLIIHGYQKHEAGASAPCGLAPCPCTAGRFGTYRGYNVAPAKGLMLYEVRYPAAVDDPTALLYPDLPHDEHGRLLARIPDELVDDG